MSAAEDAPADAERGTTAAFAKCAGLFGAGNELAEFCSAGRVHVQQQLALDRTQLVFEH